MKEENHSPENEMKNVSLGSKYKKYIAYNSIIYCILFVR